MGRARGGTAAKKFSASHLRRRTPESATASSPERTFPAHRRPYPGERSIEEYLEVWQQAYNEAVSEGVLPGFARLRANRTREVAFSEDTGLPMPGTESYEYF